MSQYSSAPGTPIKRTATSNPDQRWVAVLTISFVLMVMLSSMVFSFTAILDAAKWTGNPSIVLWLAPLFIDGAILTYTATYAVLRWRGRETAKSRRALRRWTGVSVVINVVHVGVFWEWSWLEAAMYGGMAIGGLAPIAALGVAEECIKVVFDSLADAEKIAEARALAEREAQELQRLNIEAEQAAAAERAAAARAEAAKAEAEAAAAEREARSILSGLTPITPPAPIAPQAGSILFAGQQGA